MAKYKGRVLLVDGNNYLMRGNYATPPLTDSKGKPSNAIKGFFVSGQAPISKRG